MNEPNLRRHAGFWRRLLAFLVDSLLLTALSLLLFYALYGPVYFREVGLVNEQVGYYWHWELLINWLLPLLLAVFFWVRFQGTPGKLLLNCKIVDACTGFRLSVAQAILRYLAYFVSILPLGLGFLWIVWDRRKQGFHDKIAGTVVIVEDESQKSLAELERELQ